MKAAVLVSYCPDNAVLERTLKSLLSQVDALYWVDNGSSSRLPEFPTADNLVFIGLDQNMGIATAQNLGIRAAIEDAAEFILLSDQDTFFPLDTLDDLIKTFQRWPNAAAVVPLFKDKNKKAADGFILENTCSFIPKNISGGDHKLFQAIASGKVLRVASLQQTGLMDESLFIDWVDLEWCWRARKHGFEVIGNASITIEHSLGDSAKDLGFREVNLRSPVRHYYITRNAFYLAFRSPYLSLPHRIVLLVRSLRYLIAFPLLSRPRGANISAVSKALYHGVTGKLGPRR